MVFAGPSMQVAGRASGVGNSCNSSTRVGICEHCELRQCDFGPAEHKEIRAPARQGEGDRLPLDSRSDTSALSFLSERVGRKSWGGGPPCERTGPKISRQGT